MTSHTREDIQIIARRKAVGLLAEAKVACKDILNSHEWAVGLRQLYRGAIAVRQAGVDVAAIDFANTSADASSCLVSPSGGEAGWPIGGSKPERPAGFFNSRIWNYRRRGRESHPHG